jgi:hypothetical protein
VEKRCLIWVGQRQVVVILGIYIYSKFSILRMISDILVTYSGPWDGMIWICD